MKMHLIPLCAVLSYLISTAAGKCTGYRSPISLSSASGTIMSPKYPSSYSDLENCIFKIQSPFSHRDYMLVYDVTEYETSYMPHGEKTRKCTGHLKFFKESTTCERVGPFCNVYYMTSYCAPRAQKKFPNCTMSRKSSLSLAEIQFTSESYYPKFTPQKGFKLKYEFLECTPETTTPKPTTTTTTTRPTTTTTTTEETTTTTTTPVSTTALTTTTPLTTTTEMTTEEVTTQSSDVTSLMTAEQSTTSEQKIVGILGDSSFEKQTSGGPPSWIYAPIAVGIVLVIIFIIVIVVIRRRKKKDEDINWLMNLDNAQFAELREKENKEQLKTDPTTRPQNYYQPAPN